MATENPLILKLEHGARLTDEDRRLLRSVAVETRLVDARQDLIREGEVPDAVHLVLDGFACRYKMLDDGGRSIVAFLLPGDFCDLHVAILGHMDHSIGTLAPCIVVEIPRVKIEELTTHPRIARALWWATLVDEAILREWLVSMGRRPAHKQLAHLLCELLFRLRAVGRASDGMFELPVTQEELGDALGVSTVHVNRVLQQLREDGLISLQGRLVTILDLPALTRFSTFNPNYLHLRNGPRDHAVKEVQEPRLV